MRVRRGLGGRITVVMVAVVGLLAASLAVAPVPAGADSHPPPPDYDGEGGSVTDGARYLYALVNASGGSDSSGPGSGGHVSFAPSPYADCTFTVAPLIEIVQIYFSEVFDPSIEQTIRDNADQQVEDGTTTGDGPDLGGPLGVLLVYIDLLIDYLQAHAHFLGLAGDDLENLSEPFVLVTCPPEAIRQDVYVWQQGDPPPPSLVDAYRDQAYEEIPFPVLGVNSAPAGTPDEPLVVNVETWLWSNDLWGPAQAQAGIPGIVQVTTTATPVITEWDPGNGQDPVICSDPGRVWSPTLDEGEEPTCSLRYLSSSSLSPTGTFTLTRSTRWEVEWVCEPACGGGPLDPVIVQESREVSVAEIQAIVTDT